MGIFLLWFWFYNLWMRVLFKVNIIRDGCFIKKDFVGIKVIFNFIEVLKI